MIWAMVCCSETLLVAAWLAAFGAAMPAADRPDARRVPETMWHVTGEGRGTPAVIGDAVYFLSKHHEVVSIDIATGRVRWRRSTGEPGEQTQGSRLVSNGRDVLVAGDQNLIAFDVNGRMRWRFVPPDGYGPGLYLGAIAGGLVFAGSPAGRLYAVDERTGARRWSVLVKASTTTVFAPVVDDEDVVAAFSTFGARGTGGLVVVDRATGRERWRRLFPAGRVRGFGGGLALTRAEIIASSRDGAIHAFSRRKGTLQWSWPPTTGGWFGDDPSSQDNRPLLVVGPTLVAGSLSGVVVGYDVAGRRERWRTTPSDGSVGMGLTGDERTVYVPFFSGEIVALDLDTGRESWRTPDDVSGFSWAPLAFGGALFAAGSATGFVAFR